MPLTAKTFALLSACAYRYDDTRSPWKWGDLTDRRDYNECRSKTVALLKRSGEVMPPLDRMREELGKWDELLEERIRAKTACDGLFFDLKENAAFLTPENQTAIDDLKRTFYPPLLCGLYKCYERKGRLQDAEAVLLKARSFGSPGAELLLFSLYAGHWPDMEKSDSDADDLINRSFRRVAEIDVFSETVANEINNAYFHAGALMALSVAYSALDDNADQSFACLVRTLRLDLPADVRETIRRRLDCFPKRSGHSS